MGQEAAGRPSGLTGGDGRVAVVLIGFSGTGKSTVGQHLARLLGWEFYDSDVEIEAAAGMRIHEIFARGGESEFRRFEREAVARAFHGRSRVVAVGGGAVVDPTSRAQMKDGNLVVLLDAGVETLYRRLREDVADEPRPMLATLDPLERISTLKGMRESIYQEMADLLVDTDGLTIEEVAARIAAEVRDRMESGFGKGVEKG